MNESERDFYLQIFLKHTETGKTPPPELMEFVAEGVREFLRGGKPWQIQGGRPGWGSKSNQHYLSVQCYALESVGIERTRAAFIVNIANNCAKTHRRYIKHGKSCVEVASAGHWSYVFAIEILLKNNSLTRVERAALSQKLTELKSDEDLQEPKYT